MRFAVRSPAQRLEGSPRSHRRPDGDVPGSVHVFGMSAGDLFCPAWRPVLHREIPPRPSMRTMLQRHRLVYGRGLEPEPHASTLTTTTDILRRDRRFFPGCKTGVSTPRNR